MDTTLSLPVRLGILALMLIIWIGAYFGINRLRIDPQRRINSAIPLDRKIPFVPQLALPYFSTYVFVLQPFFILSQARLFYWMLACFVSITILSSLIHAVVPSKIERMENLNTDGLSGKLIDVFQRACKPYGNFPSMHVALSVPVVGASFYAAGPLMGSIALIWGLLIALSTLFTKQHTVLDVLAGMLNGIVVFALTFWLMMA
ncbi:MAG: phosphatase PAP2 family protein [Anaerolineae bacterium]|nr:phosphatase PAP2 family protein [Anaerolineae bacterium]